MPRLRHWAKQVAFRALGRGPLLKRRLAQLRKSRAAIILNLHRVAPDDNSGYRPLAPELFDELVGFVVREFDVRTIDDLERPSDRARLVLSFDDGYRDFWTYARPILDRHRIRVNHNVIPACIESGLPPLNVIAQDFVGRAPMELVAALDVPGFTIAPGSRPGHQLSNFLKYRPMAEQEQLLELLMPQFQRFDGFEPTPIMTLGEVREIAARHEVGAHSYAHASMEYETDDYLRNDVRRCRDYFAQNLGIQMAIYAFPNGSCRPGQVEIVRSEGIDHVLLVGEDLDRDPVKHRRFTFDASTSDEMRFKAAGRLAPPAQ